MFAEAGDNRRFYFGGRWSVMGLTPIPDGSVDRSTTSPEYHWTSNTEGNSSRFGYGPSVGVRFSPRFSVGADWLFRKFKYTETTEFYSGSDAADATTVIEDTRARIWDVPVLFRARDLKFLSFRKHAEVLLGGTFRNVHSVNSGTTTILPDADDDPTTSDIPARPSHKNVAGITAGFGFRYVDDYSFKLTPEIRYTYWTAQTFDRDSIRSRRHQVEVLIGITF
jgi:hypothetical protein